MRTRKTVSETLVRWGLAAAFLVVLGVPFALRPKATVSQVSAEASNLPDRKLVIISPHWEGIRTEFGRAFSAWTAARDGHTTTIEWLDVGGTSAAIRYVESEFARAPEGINIDLFFGGGVDPYIQLSEKGLLSQCKLPPQILDPIPQKFAGIDAYDVEGRWFGACYSGFGIIYNKKVLEFLKLPPPEAWHDLAHPKYFTWVASGDPRASGSVHMAYEIILQAYGWDEGWANIVRMGGNIRNFSASASEVPKDAALGEVACGMAIDLYAWQQIAEAGTDVMGFVLPQGLTVVNPDGIAVLKGAPNRDLAEKFVEFVLGEPGQKLWTLKVGAPGGPVEFALDRMPMVPGFAARFGEDASVKFDPYLFKGGFTYNTEKGSLRWGILNDLIGATLIDTHGELTDAWKAVKDRSSDDTNLLELVRPPISEEDLVEMARKQWKDPEFRARTRVAWTTEAKARYRRIARSEP